MPIVGVGSVRPGRTGGAMSATGMVRRERPGGLARRQMDLAEGVTAGNVKKGPSIIILDEPTAALSVALMAEVLNLVERLRERSRRHHDQPHLAYVLAVADTAVVLRLGRNNGSLRWARSAPRRSSLPSPGRTSVQA